MHIWESVHVYRVTRVRIGAYLGNDPPYAINREVSAQLRNNSMHVGEQDK